MAVILKKSSDGKVFASNREGSNTILAGKGFRMRDDRKVEVLHFINVLERWCVWAIKNPRFSMLNDQPSAMGDNVFRTTHRTSGRPGIIQYDGVVFMRLNKFDDLYTIQLVDAQGGVLAGSNIFPYYDTDHRSCALCLGDSYNPFTLSPIDLLLFNQANMDLEWRGDELFGEWIADPIIRKVFNITQWPTWHPTQPIPQEVIDATALLLPT